MGIRGTDGRGNYQLVEFGATDRDIVLFINNDTTGRGRSGELIATRGGIEFSAPDTLTVLGSTDGPVVVIKGIARDGDALIAHGTGGTTSQRVVTSFSGGTVSGDGGAHRGRGEDAIAILGGTDGVTRRGFITIITDQITRLTELLAGAAELRVLNSAELGTEVGDQFTARGGEVMTNHRIGRHIGNTFGVISHLRSGVTRVASHSNTIM
jgi:hypothetical protein